MPNYPRLHHLERPVFGFYTCRLCCSCNTVFISLISVCGHPLNSLHCLLPTATGLTAHNLMLSTGTVQLCPSVALSPTSCQQAHLIIASDIVLHASSPFAVNGLLCKTNSKTGFRLLLPVLHYKTGNW